MATKTLFEHLTGLTDKKTPWEELTEADRKTVSAFMINRFLSMNMDFIEFVNDIQKYTIGTLQPREVYKLYLDVLPKKKMYFKYIKGDKEDKYNPKLIEILTKHYECSINEAKEYIDIFLLKDTSKESLRVILKMYGLDDKEIKKLF